jgi:hypothetical protein
VQNERKSEIKGEIPGRIERGLVRVDGGEATDFWRIRCMSLREKWRSTELPSLSFPLIFGKLFAIFLIFGGHGSIFFDRSSRFSDRNSANVRVQTLCVLLYGIL